MAIRLARGTKEAVQVLVVDDSQVTEDLSGSSPHYLVTQNDGTTSVVASTAASAVDMTIYCILDTTGWTALEDEFWLYVTFTVGSEVPKLGPFVINLT